MSAPASGAPALRDAIILTLINVAWGSSYVVSRGALEAMPPLLLSFLRMALAAACLAAIGAHRDRKPIPAGHEQEGTRRADRAALLVAGLLGFGLAKVLLYEGLARSTATDAALIINLEPVFTAALALAILRQQLAAPQWAGLLVACFGGLALVWPEPGSTQAQARAFGNILMVGAVAAEAAASVLGARLLRRHSGLQVTALGVYLGTAALLLPACLQTRALGVELAAFSLPNIAAVLYLAIVTTVVGYTLWYQVLHRVDAGRAAAYLYVQPLVGVLLGIGIRGEWPTWTGGLGGALVLLGICLASRSSGKPK